MDPVRLLSETIFHATPILLCVLGGIFAYKAGVLNIALEGFMLSASFVSVLVSFLTQNILLGYLFAVLSCLVWWAVFSYMGVARRGNVIVIGLAINMLVPAIAGFVMRQLGMSSITLPWFSVSSLRIDIPIIQGIPVLGDILSGYTAVTYLAFAGIAVMWVLLYRTRFGTYVRVAGENEDAAVSLGIRTKRYKSLAVGVGALCCALAGINLSLEGMGLYTNHMTAGRGFIAIAAIYCGRGHPVSSSVYAIVFGFARALAVNVGVFAGPASVLFDIIPYLVMTVVLTVVSIVKRRGTCVRGF